jgi:menaquinone-dependent protoporphyrinogen oxidase
MKIAIVYGTKYNTVKSCVEKLTSGLKGHSVTSFPIKQSKVIPLEEFDTVILGGSIYLGRTQKELVEFSKKRESELLQKKLGLFLCSAFALPQEFSVNFSESLLKHSLTKENFGYEMHPAEYTWMEKTVVKMIPAKDLGPEGIKDSKIQEFIVKILS